MSSYGHFKRFCFQSLKKLQEYLSRGKIPYVFDPSCNVLWGMGEQEKYNKARWLAGAVAKLERVVGTEDCYETWMGAFTGKGI